MLGLRLKRKPDGPRRRELEAEVHRLLELGPLDVVRLTEDSCGVPNCAVLLTMLIMREGRRTEIFHVDGDLASVTAAELVDAMHSPTLEDLAVLFARALAKLDRKDNRDVAEDHFFDRSIR